MLRRPASIHYLTILQQQSRLRNLLLFHTHKLTWGDIENADNKSVEIDTQEVDETVGDYLPDVVVSHHPWAYLIYANNPPKQENMLRAAEVVEAVKDRNVFVKFDVKSASQFTYDWVIGKRRDPIVYVFGHKEW